jgi:hypothetical protein
MTQKLGNWRTGELGNGRTRRDSLLASFVLAIAATLAAQQQPSRDAQTTKPVGSAVVSGTVLVGPTGTEPARRTRVTLNTSDRGISGRTTTTDDAGRFAFREVPAGRFTLQAVRPGFLTASYGARRAGRPGTAVPVAEGAPITNLTLRIIKGGVITGTAVDGNGQPAPGVSISVLRFTYREMTGERALSTETVASTATTDDRGIYRAWGLPPGNYVVMATPQMGGAGRGGQATDFQVLTGNDVSRAIAAAKARAGGAAPQPPPPAQRVNYAPVFFPGTPEVAQATTVTLTESEERAGIDIPIRLFRTARIDGTVRMADGSALPQTVPVTLMPGGPQGDLLGARGGSRISTARVDAAGKFVFGGVTPGRYAVIVNTGQTIGGRGSAVTSAGPNALWAMAEVTMDGTDATVHLTLQPAMRGTGRVVFEGASEKPKDLTGLRIVLVPPGAGGSLSAGPPGGQVSADGTFTFTNVIPGAYRIFALSSAGLSSSGWYLQSATGNGRDAWDAWLDVGPGENLDLVLTYTDRPTQITGTIRDGSGQPVLEPFIVVFPAERSRWVPGSKRLVAVRPGADGQYSVAGLPPGDYLLAALSDVEPGEWNDPAFLETLAPAGIKISLTTGEKKTQNLEVR